MTRPINLLIDATKFQFQLFGLLGNLCLIIKAFTDFLQAGSLRADQITFTRTFMAYFIKNGVLDKTLLYESPFTDINDQSLNGLFEDAKVIQLVRIIDGINNNATLA